ncbi:hypothetical protein QBC44DRAFT_303042 [Cladorrhinum sp. PSN332]|nr:hypothetical protein QBC44DRAFT_303042 [Cladorrhinum sp. PSN332]
MKTTTSIIATLAAFFASANALAAPARRADTSGTGSVIPAGFNIVELSWEVETTPGGPKVILNGTLEQAHEKLVEINPNWNAEYLEPVIADQNAEAKSAARSVTGDVASLQKRDWTECKTRGGGAQTAAIRDGISYLRGLSGEARNGPGPRNCGRVSCSYSSAIWYCNNNNYAKSMPWYHIANAAQVLLDQCSWTNIGGYRYAAGERHHDDGWFTIVAYEGSNC